MKAALGQDQPGIQPLNAPLQSWSQSRWGLPLSGWGRVVKRTESQGQKRPGCVMSLQRAKRFTHIRSVNFNLKLTQRRYSDCLS